MPMRARRSKKARTRRLLVRLCGVDTRLNVDMHDLADLVRISSVLIKSRRVITYPISHAFFACIVTGFALLSRLRSTTFDLSLATAGALQITMSVASSIPLVNGQGRIRIMSLPLWQSACGTGRVLWAAETSTPCHPPPVSSASASSFVIFERFSPAGWANGSERDLDVGLDRNRHSRQDSQKCSLTREKLPSILNVALRQSFVHFRDGIEASAAKSRSVQSHRVEKQGTNRKQLEQAPASH